MKRTQVYLAKSQLSYLQKNARRKKTTVSSELRSIIDESIKSKCRKTVKAHPSAGLKGLLDLATKNKIKGPRDLSQNLDNYLYGDN